MGTHRTIRDILVSVREPLTQAEYTAYLKAVYYGASKLVDSTFGEEGRQSYRCVSTGKLEDVAVAIRKCDMAQHLLYVLGYENIADRDLLVVSDLETSLPALKAFCEIAEDELLVKCDPLGLEGPPPLSDPIVVAIFLSYHLYLRVQLLIRCTSRSMLHRVAESLIGSINTVESSAGHLGLMPDGSEALTDWTTARDKALDFVSRRGHSLPRHPIEQHLQAATELIATEMKGAVGEKISAVNQYLHCVLTMIDKANKSHQIGRNVISRYQRSCARFPKNCWSEEYGRSMDEIHDILEKTVRGDTEETDVEKLHAVFVWQASNFLSHFHLARNAAVDTTTSDGRDASSVPIQELRQTMDDVKKSIGVLEFRSFVRNTHRNVSSLVKHNGELRCRSVEKLDERPLSCDMNLVPATRLLSLLGYVQAEARSSSMILVNYAIHRPLLEMFVELGKEVLIVSRGDAAGLKSVDGIDNVSSLVAYLAYHFRLRCCLLSEETPIHLLDTVLPEIEISLKAVESVADRVRVMTPGGQTRAAWNNVRQKIVNFFRNVKGHDSSRREVRLCLDEMASRLEMDLRQIVPFHLMAVVSYSTSVAVMISTCKDKRAIKRQTAEVYTACCRCLVRGAFSNEYCHVSDEILEFLELAKLRHLNRREVERVYILSVWQSENFVSHFRHEAFTSINRTTMLFPVTRHTDNDHLFGIDIAGGRSGRTATSGYEFCESTFARNRSCPSDQDGTAQNSSSLSPAYVQPVSLFASEIDIEESNRTESTVEETLLPVRSSFQHLYSSGSAREVLSSDRPVDFRGAVAQSPEEFIAASLATAAADDLDTVVDSLVVSRGNGVVQGGLERLIQTEESEAHKLHEDIRELQDVIEKSAGCDSVTISLSEARDAAVRRLASVSSRESVLKSTLERLKNCVVRRGRLEDLRSNAVVQLLYEVLSSARLGPSRCLVSLVSCLPDEMRCLLSMI